VGHFWAQLLCNTGSSLAPQVVCCLSSLWPHWLALSRGEKRLASKGLKKGERRSKMDELDAKCCLIIVNFALPLKSIGRSAARECCVRRWGRALHSVQTVCGQCAAQKCARSAHKAQTFMCARSPIGVSKTGHLVLLFCGTLLFDLYLTIGAPSWRPLAAQRHLGCSKVAPGRSAAKWSLKWSGRAGASHSLAGHSLGSAALDASGAPPHCPTGQLASGLSIEGDDDDEDRRPAESGSFAGRERRTCCTTDCAPLCVCASVEIRAS